MYEIRLNPKLQHCPRGSYCSMREHKSDHSGKETLGDNYTPQIYG